MNKFIKRIKDNQALYVLSILIIGILLLLIARITYAYLAPRIQSALGNVTTISDTVDDFKLELGQPLSLNATATTLPESGSNLVVTSTEIAKLKANSTKKTATYNYYLYLQITNNTFKYSDGTTPEIILTITDPNGNEITSLDNLTYGTYNGVSGFDVTTKTGLFNIANNYEITSNSSSTYTEHDWNITLTYLNLNIDQSGNYGNSFETKLYLQKEEMKPTLSKYVISQYTGTQGENSIYYHDSNLTNGANDNSYRYAGANPNNYVCFGSDESTCPNDNLYRIIGVFNNQIKLIKYDYANSNLLGTNGDYKSGSTASSSYYIGKNSSTNVYYWNYQSDTSINQSHGSNTWSTSLLNKINLNTNYLNNIGSKWANMIDTVVWKVGGNTQANLANVNVINAYKNEIINPTSTITYDAKIGLMYISDYGFSADPSCWTTTLSSFYNNNSTNKVWMFMGYSEYTLTPSTTSEDGVMGIAMTGAVSSYTASVDNAIRPVFYLNTNVKMLSGDGTKTTPYRVG